MHVVVDDMGELYPRTRAVDRARAESEAIAHVKRLQRVEVELHTLETIRKERLWQTKKAQLTRLGFACLAVGITCGAAGYLIGALPAKSLQSIAARQPTGNLPGSPATTLPSRQPGQPPSEQTADAQPGKIESAHVAVEPTLSHTTSPDSLRSVTSVTASTSSLTPLVPVAISLPPIPASVALIAPKPVAVPFPVKALNQQARPLVVAKPVVHHDASRPLAQSVLELKPVESGVDVTLAKPRQALKQAESTKPISDPLDFKVTSVMDGFVMIRQGQSVKQVKVGEKLPNGKTVQAVNPEKGSFEAR